MLLIALAAAHEFVPEEPAAVLVVESGTVEVGEPFRTVRGSIELSEGDTIITGPGSSAYIELFDSSVVRLDENTTITLAEIKDSYNYTSVYVNQSSGRIWNKVTKLSGIDSYSVETPTSVASVRGTSFESVVEEDGTSTGVEEGNVTVRGKETNDVVIVGQNQSAKISRRARPAIKALERNAWVAKNSDNDKEFEIKVREKVKAKNALRVKVAEIRNGLSDEEVDRRIDKLIKERQPKEQIRASLEKLGVKKAKYRTK